MNNQSCEMAKKWKSSFFQFSYGEKIPKLKFFPPKYKNSSKKRAHKSLSQIFFVTGAKKVFNYLLPFKIVTFSKLKKLQILCKGTLDIFYFILSRSVDLSFKVNSENHRKSKTVFFFFFAKTGCTWYKSYLLLTVPENHDFTQTGR